MKKNLVISLFLFLCPLCFYAQNGRFFSANAELSSSLINDIHQDHNGIIWIATEDGLNKYDGAKFETYKHKNKEPSSILNNYVKTIFEDRDHNLYFGFFNGLQVYDSGTDTFKSIPLSAEENTSYDAHVTTITQRANGELLVGTSGRGIFRLDKNGDDYTATPLDNFVPTSFIDKIYEDSQQNLWIVTPQSGLFFRDFLNRTASYFENANIRATLSDIVEDPKGTIYVGSYTKGLFQYVPDEGAFKAVPNTNNVAIHSLFINDKKEFLVGTDGNGLYHFDPERLSFVPKQLSVSSFDFSKSKVHTIIQDSEENIWLGLYQKGVVLLPNKLNNFNYIGYESASLDIIGSNCVMAVYKDSEGILWVGTDGDGLYRISPSQNNVTHYKDQDYLGRRLNTVVTIVEDHNKNIWIGTYLNGLAKINRNTLKPQFIENLVDEQSNPVKNIYSIVEDDANNLWLGSMGSGLFQLNLTTNTITSHNISLDDLPKGPKFFNNKWINNLLLDKSNNRLYVGSYDGLSRFNIKSKQFEAFEDGLRKFDGEIVYTLHKDRSQNLWVGTANGLSEVDAELNEIKRYTIDDGLPSNTICSIEEDKEGDFWISTNQGISVFNPTRKNFLNYFFNDGLQGNEFSKNASFFYNKNQLFFGGMNGVTYFNPSEITNEQQRPELFISDLYLQNKPVREGMTSGKFTILNKPLYQADTLQLAYKDNSFSIEFSSLEYVNPKRISYSYAVNNGLWVNLIPGLNTVAFDNLEAGTYTFKIRAKDFDKYSEIKELTVIIHPLWYLTSTAKVIYLIAFLIFAAFMYYLLKQRQLSKERLREYSKSKQINEAKLQFLTNIAHDIKTPLTLIVNPLRKLIHADGDPLRQKSYKIIYRNTDRILNLTRQFLDVRKIDGGELELKFEKTELVSYIQNICSLFEDQIEDKELNFKFKHEQERLYAWIDPNYFDKVVQNLVANAVKFVSKGGLVHVELDVLDEKRDSYDQPYFCIRVTDDGIGIEQGREHLVFDRFYQAKGTPHHIEGTGIGLHLTRSIAQLHYGTIYAKNNDTHKGCSFMIHIPLGNKHLPSEQLVEQVHLKKTPENKEQIEKEPLSEEISNDTIYGASKVVIVDDDVEIRRYLQKELATTFNILTAPNGKEALSLILSERPQLVISDIMMPEMDGFELCHAIKKNININHIPVILLTAKSSQERNLESLTLGADAYIPKPFDISILQKTASNLIQNRKLLKNNYDGSQSQEERVKPVELKSSDEILLEKVIEFINKNLNNSDLNVEMIAQAVGISRVHLYRKLKELTNQAASDLIKNIRLKQAADLLVSKQISVAEVAYAVGFSNLSTFSTNFKSLYGTPPKKYQEKHLKKEE